MREDRRCASLSREAHPRCTRVRPRVALPAPARVSFPHHAAIEHVRRAGPAPGRPAAYRPGRPAPPAGAAGRHRLRRPAGRRPGPAARAALARQRARGRAPLPLSGAPRHPPLARGGRRLSRHRPRCSSTPSGSPATSASFSTRSRRARTSGPSGSTAGPFSTASGSSRRPSSRRGRMPSAVRHAREFAAALEALARGRGGAAGSRGRGPLVAPARRGGAGEHHGGRRPHRVARGRGRPRRCAPVRRCAHGARPAAPRDRARPRGRVPGWSGSARARSLAPADARPAPLRSRAATGVETRRRRPPRASCRRSAAPSPSGSRSTDRAAESTMLLSFAARDRRDTRPVELHVLTPRLASLAPVDRVLAALERVAALHDPRIVPIRDCGLLQGVVWFATPPVEGTSLARPARARPPAPAATRRSGIASDLLEVLVYAHGRDVRHGDLRPKHVLLGPDRASPWPPSAWSRRSTSAASRGTAGQHRGDHRRARPISPPSSSPARPPPTSAAISTASAASSSRCSPASRPSAAPAWPRC